MTTLVIVNPADVNLADAKALAAEHDATVVGNPYVPRGRVFMVDTAALGLEEPT